ncbi:chemotaxis protein CheV [Lutibacter sp. B2]|nr:chemotaxis protein CheV [Lutibacter sp. B2]
MRDKRGILLESGTGDVEILEFVINDRHYAINVIKTKEIVEIENVTEVPNSNEAIAGMSLIRGNTITLVDLKYVLEQKKQDYKKKNMALLCEFNKRTVAFLVDKVIGIHRIGWDKINKPDSIVEQALVIGNIVMEDSVLMMLDFEKIVMDIEGRSYGAYEGGIEKIKYKKDRSKVKLVLVDDSATIRYMLKDVLNKGGYTNLTFFDNGKHAFEYLDGIKDKNKEKISEYVDIVITDIEMPQMDGHTLTRKIKEDKILKNIPVAIFSSLITGDLHHKGEAVGADVQMSKPDIDDLVEFIDNYTLGKK